MSTRSLSKSPFTQFEIHKITSTEKHRHSDSPTSSILKTPTAIFVSSRSSSTKRLKFANGPVDLQTLKNGSDEASVDNSAYQTPQNQRANGNGEIISSDSTIEVAISPVKTMQVSPESWEAFLEYKKYNDYANETEKTDYTYSRLSRFRDREIIPGFLARPNLSRSSISSSRKSSLSSPSNQSSYNESYFSYDFKVDGSPRSDFKYDYKLSDLLTKSPRSKYNLRSSGLEDTDVSKLNTRHNYSLGETDISTRNSYTEKDYFSDSVEPKIVKRTINYSTTTPAKENTSQVSSQYLTKVRSLDLDDDDIDEVDENAVNHEKHYYGKMWLKNRSQQQASNAFSKFFTAAFLYLTTFGNQTKDFFTKHILRKKDDDLNQDNFRYSTSGGSGVSWTYGKQYTSPHYYADQYYGLQPSWYQRFASYFTDKYSQLSSFLLGDRTRYSSYSQQRDSKRRKLWWWLLLPLLILGGSFLGYIDFFSNPKAILNTMYNCLLFFPSFLHYTAAVFVPRLILDLIPYFFLTVVPSFVTVTLPGVFAGIANFLWEMVHWLASISLANVWNFLLAAPQTLFNMGVNLAGAFGVFLLNLISTGYSVTSEYLMLFHSHFCLETFNLVARLFQGVWYCFDVIHQAWPSF